MLWIQFCSQLSERSSIPHILLRVLFSTNDLLVTGWSSVLTEVVQDGRLSVRRSVGICRPWNCLCALYFASGLHIQCESPKSVGTLGEMGSWSPKHCHRLHASHVWYVRLHLSINSDKVPFWSFHCFAQQVSGHQNSYSDDWIWYQNTDEAHKVRQLGTKSESMERTLQTLL